MLAKIPCENWHCGILLKKLTTETRKLFFFLSLRKLMGIYKSCGFLRRELIISTAADDDFRSRLKWSKHTQKEQLSLIPRDALTYQNEK